MYEYKTSKLKDRIVLILNSTIIVLTIKLTKQHHSRQHSPSIVLFLVLNTSTTMIR